MIAPLETIAQFSATRIVDCLLEGTLIGLFAALVLRMSRRQSSGTRFAVWFAALMAIATMPLLSHALWAEGAITPARSAVQPMVTLPVLWAVYLFALWAGVATWGLMRVGMGIWHLRRVRGCCLAVDVAQLDPVLRETMERNQGARRVVLCTSEQVQVPTAVGLFEPAVVIPHWLLEELSPEELNQVLLHELAHLQRWDDWTNLAQQVVKALLFFHPAVWWIERRVSLEREMACDDAVLAETAKPRAYAECLTRLAEKTLIRRTLALAQGVLGRVHQTSLRVAQILDANRPQSTKRIWRPAVTLIAGFAIACAVGVSRVPRPIAFEDLAPSRTPMIASSVPVVDSSVSKMPRVSATPAKFVPRVQRPRVVPAKHKVVVPALSQPTESLETAFFMEAGWMQPSMVDLMDSGANSAASTEMIVLVVEHQDTAPGQPMFQIQVLRFTLAYPVHTVSQQVPTKKT
jgi:beta-lactamase regulating signal transducer with metallopeptidase domain